MSNFHPIKALTTIIILALFGGTWSSPVAADTTNGVCVTSGHRFIGPQHPSATARQITLNLPAEVPAGNVTVEVWYSDSYEGRATTGHWHQTNEVVTVLGVTGSDLEDWTASANGYATGTATLAEATDTVTVHHPATSGIDSVNLDRVCLTPHVEVVPEPVVEPAPEPTPTPAPQPEPKTAPTPETPAEPVCEDNEKCAPACPTGTMRTRTSGAECVTIEHCPTVTTWIPLGGFDAISAGTVTPMSPTGLLADCPTEVVPVTVTYTYQGCVWQ